MTGRITAYWIMPVKNSWMHYNHNPAWIVHHCRVGLKLKGTLSPFFSISRILFPSQLLTPHLGHEILEILNCHSRIHGTSRYTNHLK